jgi:hypothetical protein
MNKLIILIFLSLLLQGPVFSYTNTTTAKCPEKKCCTKKCFANKEVKCTQNCKNKTDYFIDKDKDGICDQRAKGMGFNSKKRQNANNCPKNNGQK